MEYQYTPAGENYEMYAAGGVFYSAPGLTAFPVRLAVEIFRRCLALRAAWGTSDPAVVYDPCCGGAYHLATMAYFNWDNIARIDCSDVDVDALSVAKRNLSLLTLSGLENRIEELSSLHQQFGKESHAAALQNALVLKRQLAEFSMTHHVATQLFRADATDSHSIAARMAGAKVDVVFTDIPYGQWSNWSTDTLGLTKEPGPIHQLLESLQPFLAAKAVVAVAAAKKDKVDHERYRRLQKFNVGKRQVVILMENP